MQWSIIHFFRFIPLNLEAKLRILIIGNSPISAGDARRKVNNLVLVEKLQKN